jgi:hypothetical protein
MSYFTHSQIFHINSRNRDLGTDSDFTITLSDIDTNVKYDYVALLDCSIPRSYYMIQANYNTFILNEGGSDLIISVNPGNYTRTSLKSIIETLLNASGTFTYSISYRNISSTYDDGKFVFTVSGNSGVQPLFTFGDGFFEILGFSKNTTYNFVANTLTSPNVINLNHESTLFLKSNICQNTDNNILDNIITPADISFSYIIYNNSNPSEYSKKFNGNGSNNFRFQLTDEDNRPIDLNGLNFLFTIMIYKKDRTNQFITNYIKMLELKNLD